MRAFRKKRVYLDWAASAPVSPDALRVFRSAVSLFGNPSSPHEDGVRARTLLEESRAVIARLAEVRPSGVVFTSGATEANNLALRGMPSAHILYLPGAHASVTETVRALVREGTEATSLRFKGGKLDLEHLKENLRPETRLVVLDAVCGETGTLFDTRGARNVLDLYAKENGTSRIHLHVDASQAPLAASFDLTRLAADTAALDAQKVGGIRGVGVLLRREHVKPSPLMEGGGQEGGLRPGTEPVALIAAFAAALTKAHKEQQEFALRAGKMRARLLETLAAALPDLEVNQGTVGVPHILNLSFPGRDTDYAVMLLDQEGLSVSTKSACESDSLDGSRAVLALTNDPERARSTLRISWGPTTRAPDLDRFAMALERAIRFLDVPSV